MLLDLGVTEHLNLSNLVFSEHGHLMLTRNLSHKNVLAPKTVEKRSASLAHFVNLCQCKPFSFYFRMQILRICSLQSIGSSWHMAVIGVSEVSDVLMYLDFHVFHVALKFQYLHTSAMYFCAGNIEDPSWLWGQQPSNNAGTQWLADNALGGSGDYAPPPPPPASGAAPVVVPARVPVPVVVVPDENEGNEGSGKKAGLGVSRVSDVCTSHPRKFQRQMPDVLKQKPKIKAKPRPTKPPQPPPTPPPTHSGAKRKNSRSPGAGSKQKAARLEAASSAPSHSGDSGVSGVASTNHISLN